MILAHGFYGIVLEVGSKEGFREVRPTCAHAFESNSYNSKAETALYAGMRGVFHGCVNSGETIVLPVYTQGNRIRIRKIPGYLECEAA